MWEIRATYKSACLCLVGFLQFLSPKSIYSLPPETCSSPGLQPPWTHSRPLWSGRSAPHSYLVFPHLLLGVSWILKTHHPFRKTCILSLSCVLFLSEGAPIPRIVGSLIELKFPFPIFFLIVLVHLLICSGLGYYSISFSFSLYPPTASLMTFPTCKLSATHLNPLMAFHQFQDNVQTSQHGLLAVYCCITEKKNWNTYQFKHKHTF